MEYIIAIDPGRDKTGVAIVASDLSTRGIKTVKTSEIKQTIMTLLEEYKNNGEEIKTIVLGDGTCSKKHYENLQQWLKDADIAIVIVDEYNTTAEGRLRYWKYNKPTGLKRLFPVSWLTPPVPVDDYTAWIIGERYFREIGISDDRKQRENK